MSRGALDWVARRWRWIAAVGVLLLLLAGASLTIRHVGSWLVVQDQLEPAPVIVVLSGRLPERAREAAAIYGQGFASEVWISRPTSPAEELEKMGIAYVG